MIRKFDSISLTSELARANSSSEFCLAKRQAEAQAIAFELTGFRYVFHLRPLHFLARPASRIPRSFRRQRRNPCGSFLRQSAFQPLVDFTHRRHWVRRQIVVLHINKPAAQLRMLIPEFDESFSSLGQHPGFASPNLVSAPWPRVQRAQDPR